MAELVVPGIQYGSEACPVAGLDSQTMGTVSVIAVATGDGIIKAFYQAGASLVIPGGPSMNPSTQQILQAVEMVPASEVIILPDDKNIVLVAHQVGLLTAKKVRVVPALTIPQGLGALSGFNPAASLQSNVESMTGSRELVRTLEITRATRSARFNGLVIEKGQPIGLLDSRLLAVQPDMCILIESLLDKVDIKIIESAVMFFGADSDYAEALLVRSRLRQKNPSLSVKVIPGGQPLYNYIISLKSK